MAASAPYDVISGATFEETNRLLNAVYHALYPNVFKGSIPITPKVISGIVGHLASSIDYDFKTPLQIRPGPSASIRSHIEEEVKKHLHHSSSSSSTSSADSLMSRTLPDFHDADLASEALYKKLAIADKDAAEAFLLDAPNSSVDIEIVNAEFHVQFLGGFFHPHATADLLLSATLKTEFEEAGAFVSFHLIQGSIKIHDHDHFTSAINEYAVPCIIKLFNEHFKPIKIPVFSFKGITVSPPMPSVQNEHMLVYSKLGVKGAPAAAVKQSYKAVDWPSNCQFLGVSQALIEQVSKLVFPITTGEKPFTCAKCVFYGTFEASLGPGPVSYNEDGTISLTTNAEIKIKTSLNVPDWLPHFPSEHKVEASIGGNFKPVYKDSKLYLELEGIPSLPKVHFDCGGPTWAETIKAKFHDAFDEAVNLIFLEHISDSLKGLKIPIASIPDVPIPLGDKILEVKLISASTESRNGFYLVKSKVDVYTKDAPAKKH